MAEIYKMALRHLLNASKRCETYANFLNRPAFYTENSNQLMAIVLALNISSEDELQKILEAKIDYLNSFYGGCPSESVVFDPVAHENEVERYRKILRVLNPKYVVQVK